MRSNGMKAGLLSLILTVLIFALPAAAQVTMTDLGTLGGFYSNAYAVNDNGQVVGESETATGEIHAFSWTAADGMTDLGTLRGGYSRAYLINDDGQVVGQALLPRANGTPSSGPLPTE